MFRHRRSELLGLGPWLKLRNDLFIRAAVVVTWYSKLVLLADRTSTIRSEVLISADPTAHGRLFHQPFLKKPRASLLVLPHRRCETNYHLLTSLPPRGGNKHLTINLPHLFLITKRRTEGERESGFNSNSLSLLYFTPSAAPEAKPTAVLASSPHSFSSPQEVMSTNQLIVLLWVSPFLFEFCHPPPFLSQIGSLNLFDDEHFGELLNRARVFVFLLEM